MNFKFEWIEKHRKEVIKIRDVDFVYVIQIFLNPVILTRENYGKKRYIALGHINDEYFILVYQVIEVNVFRLITAWKAGRYGEEEYNTYFSR